MTGHWRLAVAAPPRLMAEHLRRKGIAPELVLCSPSMRTRQTLKRLAPGLGKNADVQIEPELYAAPAADLLEVLHEVPDEVESVMLIGHNPGIQDLALSLASAGSEIPRLRSKFPTAALATLELNGTWRELAPGSAELVSLAEAQGALALGAFRPKRLFRTNASPRAPPRPVSPSS